MSPGGAHQEELLARSLRGLLDDADPAWLPQLRERLRWVELPGGATLMRQGDPGDAMYLVVSGRLRASVRDEDGRSRRVREMGRGEVIGEYALFTGDPRSATVVAIRDSVLVRLDKADFLPLLAASPELSIAMTRQLIRRLQHEEPRSLLACPVTVGLVPVSDGVDTRAFTHRLAEAIRALPQRSVRVRVVDAEAVDAALGEPGLARRAGLGGDDARRIALLLDQIEAETEVLLLLADPEPTPWTVRCTRHADELLLLADATQPPAVHRNELACLVEAPAPGPDGGDGPHTEATQVLVLLHPEGTRSPRGTRAWLARRPVSDHVHVRPDRAEDMARLARIETRTAVGLVLAGGGARGFAHLGVWRAMQEAGIPVDFVGGTSIGAVMAALVASDRPIDEVMAIARRAFGLNPTGDWNLLPMMSLFKGRRLERTVRSAIEELLGFAADAEDLWKGFFAVASNYSTASEQLLREGPLWQALLASTAIPGALPPVLRDGELLCDGGTFNNFPVDVMRQLRGVGLVAGVDLHPSTVRRIELERTPGSWALLRDRLRPRQARRYRLPSLASLLMNVTILYSTSRQRQAQRLTDLHFNPPLPRVGMLAWGSLDRVAAQGHAHARQRLAAMDAELCARLGIAGPPPPPADGAG